MGVLFIKLKCVLFFFSFFFLKVGEEGVGLRYIIDQRSDTKKVGEEKDEKKKVRYNFLCINACMKFYFFY